MEKPFILISGNMERREEFDVKEGHQPTWALLYIKKGSFELDFGNGVQEIKSGDTIIFDDSTNFRRSVVSPIVFIYIKFKVNLRCHFSVSLPVGKVDFADRERFLSTMKAYESVMELDDRKMVYYKEHLLEDVLFQLFCENEGKPDSDNKILSNDHLLRASVEYIRDNIDGAIRICDICKAVGSNPSTLNWRFRRELSMSVGAYITLERIKLAKKLIQGTTYSVGRIAEKCGYENVYYFSSAFKKCCGISPTEYRKKYE